MNKMKNRPMSYCEFLDVVRNISENIDNIQDYHFNLIINSYDIDALKEQLNHQILLFDTHLKQ